MRIVEVHIEGFGKLVGRHFHFGPGLNLMLGGNETGKSTLHRALLALLYGPEEGEDPLLESLRPWQDPAFHAGSITCVFDNGQGFRLARRFYPPVQATVHSYPDGEDLSRRYTDAAGRLRFAEEELGLSREAFLRACCLQPPREGGPRFGAAVRDALLHLVTSTPADAATSLAITQLKASLDELTATKEGAQGPLTLARDRLASALDERRRIQMVRRQRLSQARALREVAERMQALEVERSQLIDRRERARLEAAGLKPAAAAELAAEIRRYQEEAARWQAWADFPVHLRSEVLRLSIERKHLQKECALAEERATSAQETLQALNSEEAALVERLAVLSGSGEASPGFAARLERLASEWRMASEVVKSADERLKAASASIEALERSLADERKQLQPVLSLGLEGLASVHQRLQAARERQAKAKVSLTEATSRWMREGRDEAEPDQSRGEKERGGGWRSLLSRGGRSAQPRSKAAGDAAAAYANLVACRTEAEAAQRAVREVEATIFWQLGELLGGTLEDTAFAQLNERLQRFLASSAELEKQKAAVAEIQKEREQGSARCQQAEQALRAELGAVGLDTSNLEAALAAYTTATVADGSQEVQRPDWRRARVRAEADLELVRMRANALQAELRAWRDAQMALANVEASLDALFAQAGISSSPGTVDQALEAFEQGCQNHERWQQAKAALDAALRYSRALIGSEETSRPGAPSAGDWLAQPFSGARTGSEGPGDEYAAQLARIDQERAAASREHARLEAELRQAGPLPKHPAELEEEVAALQAEVERLERYRQALQTAHDALIDASMEYQKQFTPRLESWLQQGMGRLLGARSLSLSVDPEDLSVTVYVPELRRAVPAASLGAGTSELIALLFAAGVVRLVGYAREKPPLLLDEPLAHCDRSRQEKALDLLLLLAEEMQIILFTREERFADWLEQRVGASSLHQVQLLA